VKFGNKGFKWWKGREGKGREGKGREGKGREGKGREGKGREGKGREGQICPRCRVAVKATHVLLKYSKIKKWREKFLDRCRSSINEDIN
jgi:hypothetical protein